MTKTKPKDGSRTIAVVQLLRDELATLVKGESCDHETGICYCETFRALAAADELLLAVEVADQEGARKRGHR